MQVDLFRGGANVKAEAAETVAVQALGWLASQDDLYGQFLGATGASAASVAEAAGKPEFLAAVLDFVLMDDAWVIAFCDEAGIGYGLPMQARSALPGGQMVHWT